MDENLDIADDGVIDTSQKKKKSGGFQSMNLIPQVYKAILAKGFNVPTPIQRKTIPLILEGRDVVASSKTGSGKTAAFMIPLIHKLKAHSKIVGARAVILLPTRELALQTASVFKQFAKYTDLIHSVIVGGHGFEGQYESLASNPDVIIATPGRLMQHLSETNLSLGKVEYFVIDEVDQMMEMGFEEQLKIILHKLPANRQTILLSATLPEVVSSFVKVGLKDYVFVKLDSEYTIPDTMKLHFFITKSQQKLSAVCYFIREFLDKSEKTILFTATRYHVDYLVRILHEFGVQAVGVYGKMDQLTRKEQIMKFKKGECNLLVVTDLAARGIDLPFVNNVINWDFPTKPKLFIHRSGRTARAGKKGTTYTFLSPDEVLYLADLKLYLGKTLSTQGALDDFSIAHYGSVPTYLLDSYEEAIKNALKRDIEIEKMEELCSKAIKLFKKTRAPASKNSIREARTLDDKAPHLLFKEKGYDPEIENVFNELKNYRPKQSYLEFKSEKQEIVANTSALNFISQARKAAEKYKQKMEKKLRKEQEKDMDEEMSLGDDEISLNEENHKDGANKKEDELEELKEELEDDEIEISYLDKPKKKVKKSKITDFRHPTQYISDEPSKFNEFLATDKINQDDIVPFVVADETEDLKKTQKYVWDKKKKKYVVKQSESKIKFKKDKEDKTMKDEKGKKTFNMWQKKHKLQYQKVGEIENQDIVNKARELFKHRRTKGGDGSNKSKGKNEIKRPDQIMKVKKKTIHKKFKNMERSKRKKLMGKGKK